MTNPTTLIRTLITYAVVLPLAIYLGYLLSTPLDRSTVIPVTVLFFTLITPLLLRWHHPVLFLSWNMLFIIWFLPGQLDLWLFTAALSFGISVVQRSINPRVQLDPVPSVLLPLLFLALVVFITAQFNEGFQMKVMGGQSQGGKRYFYVFCGILGYIAMGSRFIPPERARLYTRLFFLGSLTYFIIMVTPFIRGPLLYLFAFFPPDRFTALTMLAAPVSGEMIGRNFGFTASCTGAFLYMLARYGIRRQLEPGNIGKLILTLTFFVGLMLGGYRSFLTLTVLTAAFLAWFEKLHRTKYAVLAGALGVGGYLLLIPLAIHVPLSIQRTLSVLPFVRVSYEAELSAQATSEWRLEIWRELVPEIPHYFWLGKGLGIKASEFEAAQAAAELGGTFTAGETHKMAGDYHNGPLSTIIQFGIWGVIGVVWFWVAAVRVLIRNYRYGDPSLRTVNCLLLSLFLGRIVQFMFVYGGFHGDVANFCGIIGLSVSLNHGMCQPASDEARLQEAEKTRPIAYPGRRFAPASAR
jgi:hypothetical protein